MTNLRRPLIGFPGHDWAGAGFIPGFPVGRWPGDDVSVIEKPLNQKATEWEADRFYRESSRIIAAPFSAIIAVGVLVLPEVMVGMTEASATRSPASPRKRNRSSTTAIGSSAVPIFEVPTGWKIVVPISPAALASEASSSPTAGPGRNSCGRYFSSRFCFISRRVVRI